MSTISISDELLSRIQAAAASRALPVEAIVAEAITAYISESLPRQPPPAPLPVSQTLRFKDPQVISLSLGKLEELAEA